ncbi:MAG TPA: hypothetical protein DCY13_08235 [Verrucomicrobiales bacterium]|nr:hypothetical protein [Verrucomicrobiales bacterium]
MFPSNPPVIMAAGERLLLVRNLSAFLFTYQAPQGIRILQWTSGGLDDKGGRIDLSRPRGR